MKRNLFVSLSVMVIAVFMLSSCSKLPQVEIDNANLAITEAQTAGADVYVPAAFTALIDSMNAVNEAIEVQKSKLFKNYKASTQKLLVVTQLAGDVKVQAENKIAELKSAINATIAEIIALNTENTELVGQAPKGKGGTSVLLAIKGDIANIESAVGQIQAIAETANYNDTLVKAKALKEQALGINTELKSVIEKYNSKTKK